jgi:primary-amine oxidase
MPTTTYRVRVAVAAALILMSSGAGAQHAVHQSTGMTIAPAVPQVAQVAPIPGLPQIPPIPQVPIPPVTTPPSPIPPIGPGQAFPVCVQQPQLCVPSICLTNPALCAGPAPVTPAGCQPHSPPPTGTPAVPGNSAVAYQQFPPSGPMKTAWFVTFDHADHRAFFISSAYFKPGPNKPWIKVLGEAGPAELFVPYQPGQPRFHDLSGFNFQLVPATPADAGPCGQIVGRDNVVVREVVDKGPLWKDDAKVYRGHKMILWATMDAANYNYIFHYAFHDDGFIEFRAAGTSANLPGQETINHVHNIIWRINVDLNGSASNNISVIRHQENPASPAWNDVEQPINGNKEGSLEWDPKQYLMLHVTNPNLANGNGSHSGYMIMPSYRGIARHQETWMRKDIWVTRYKPAETTFENIETYANGEAINNADIVVWIVTPVLHIPRDEDGRKVNGVWEGIALAMWTGFDMKPHNIFDTTPFYP